MKDWRIDYSCRTESGSEAELGFILQAESISEALRLANERIQQMKDAGDFAEAVIWDVGIMQDDVW